MSSESRLGDGWLLWKEQWFRSRFFAFCVDGAERFWFGSTPSAGFLADPLEEIGLAFSISKESNMRDELEHCIESILLQRLMIVAMRFSEFWLIADLHEVWSSRRVTLTKVDCLWLPKVLIRKVSCVSFSCDSILGISHCWSSARHVTSTKPMWQYDIWKTGLPLVEQIYKKTYPRGICRTKWRYRDVRCTFCSSTMSRRLLSFLAMYRLTAPFWWLLDLSQWQWRTR